MLWEAIPTALAAAFAPATLLIVTGLLGLKRPLFHAVVFLVSAAVVTVSAGLLVVLGLQGLGLHSIAKGHPSTVAAVVQVLVVAAIVLLMAELPVVLYLTVPERTVAIMKTANGWLGRHGRAIALAAAGVVGVYFVVHGITGLIAKYQGRPPGNPIVSHRHRLFDGSATDPREGTRACRCPPPNCTPLAFGCVPSKTRMRTISSPCTAAPTCCVTGTPHRGANPRAPRSSSPGAGRWRRRAPGCGWPWIGSPTARSSAGAA
jgi:hypothetical protein